MLGNIEGRAVLLICVKVGEGLIVITVGAGGGCLDNSLSPLSFLHSLFFSERRLDIDCNTFSKGR